jgi:hypothetical protein
VNALGLAFAFWILSALAGLLFKRWRGAVALGDLGAMVGCYLPIVDRVRRVGLRLRAYRSPHIAQSFLYVIVTVLVLLGRLVRAGLGR